MRARRLAHGTGAIGGELGGDLPVGQLGVEEEGELGRARGAGGGGREVGGGGGGPTEGGAATRGSFRASGERRREGGSSSSARVASSSRRNASIRKAPSVLWPLDDGISRAAPGRKEKRPTFHVSMVRSAASALTLVPPTVPSMTLPEMMSRWARRFLLTTSKVPVRRSISSTVSTVAIDIWLRSPSIAVPAAAPGGSESIESRRARSRVAICTSASIWATTSSTRKGLVM